MTPLPRRALAWLVLVVLAATLHAVLGRVVGDRDLVAVAVSRRDLWVVVAAAALLLTRVFLYLLAPGWALYLAARTALERRLAPPP
jgi:hypothetical protein